MFRFNFDLADAEFDEQSPFDVTGTQTSTVSTSKPTSELKLSREVSLISLLEKLPSDISYSPLSVPLPDAQPVILARRDLFDARFQLIAQDTSTKTGVGEDVLEDLAFLEAPSDLVPGIYEGGLKTWECSIDLVVCLHDLLRKDDGLLGKRIIELGCGTAVPSLYLLQRIFSLPPQPSNPTTIHLQDYNDLVFRLVTVPNIILCWYMSPASAEFRESYRPPNTQSSEEEQLPSSDPSHPGELAFSKELIAAFQKSLVDHGIELRFFTGSWQTFDLKSTGGKYDIVLTSETIYRTDSLPALIDIMRSACLGIPNVEKDEDESLAKLSETQLTISSPGINSSYFCLVAAKLVYFGVGGGVAEFVRAVEGDGKRPGSVDTIWEHKEGVKRCVMKVLWN